MYPIAWLDLKLLPLKRPNDQVLVFSECYPEDSPLRYRVMQVQFVRTCSDATFFAWITPPIGYN